MGPPAREQTFQSPGRHLERLNRVLLPRGTRFPGAPSTERLTQRERVLAAHTSEAGGPGRSRDTADNTLARGPRLQGLQGWPGPRFGVHSPPTAAHTSQEELERPNTPHWESGQGTPWITE